MASSSEFVVGALRSASSSLAATVDGAIAAGLSAVVFAGSGGSGGPISRSTSSSTSTSSGSSASSGSAAGAACTSASVAAFCARVSVAAFEAVEGAASVSAGRRHRRLGRRIADLQGLADADLVSAAQAVAPHDLVLARAEALRDLRDRVAALHDVDAVLRRIGRFDGRGAVAALRGRQVQHLTDADPVSAPQVVDRHQLANARAVARRNARERVAAADADVAIAGLRGVARWLGDRGHLGRERRAQAAARDAQGEVLGHALLAAPHHRPQ